MTSLVAAPPRSAWLRGPGFDITFIFGLAALGIASAGIVLWDESLFGTVLILDLWLLGYHHVISTYSRLAIDAAGKELNRELFTTVPLLVVAMVVVLYQVFGAWSLATVYFYWQWFHYGRQSWGVARVFQAKSGMPELESPRVAQAVFYLVPAWGLAHRSLQFHEQPGEFLGVELRVLPLTPLVVNLLGIAAAVSLAYFAVSRLAAWRRGELAGLHTAYLISHFVMFTFGYVLVGDWDTGWLAVNVWHNAQYIAFVWHFNNRKAAADPTVAARPVGRLSADRRMFLYFVVSVGISTVIYLALDTVTGFLIAPIIVYQTINFHHYVVDGVIWKVRKSAVRATLAIDPA